MECRIRPIQLRNLDYVETLNYTAIVRAPAGRLSAARRSRADILHARMDLRGLGAAVAVFCGVVSRAWSSRFTRRMAACSAGEPIGDCRRASVRARM